MKPKKTHTLSPSVLLEKVLRVLDTEIDSLQDTLQVATPEKRLDFVSKTLPIVLKYQEEKVEKSADNWGIVWDN